MNIPKELVEQWLIELGEKHLYRPNIEYIAQRAAEWALSNVSMEPSVWVDHDTGAVSFTKPLRPTYVNYFNESQLAAARQQGADKERKNAHVWVAGIVAQRIAELEKSNAQLLEALKYHQEQTRPIQRTIDAIEAAEVKP